MVRKLRILPARRTDGDIPCPDGVKVVAIGVPMKMKQMSAIIALLMFSISMRAGQKVNVKVIDRQK
jgi:hypothetical protein